MTVDDVIMYEPGGALRLEPPVSQALLVLLFMKLTLHRYAA